MSILKFVDNLIENTFLQEGSLQRRLGIRFKTIIDPKTGKSHMFQVIRSKVPGTSSAPSIAPSIIRSWDNPDKIPRIYIPNRGRTHPAAFYHEIGHELRNNPSIKGDDVRDIIRPKIEKEAWQGAKELRPDLYNMAKKDGTLQKSFGSYVDHWRNQDVRYRNLERKLDRIPDTDTSKGLMRSAVGVANMANEFKSKPGPWLRGFVKGASEAGAPRDNIAKAIKFARPLTGNYQKRFKKPSLLKVPEQTPEQIELYKNRGWNLVK